MRLKFFFSTLALMLALFVAAANAQQVTAAPEAPVQEPLKISGRMFAEWLKTLGNQNDSGENENTFQLTRVYLDFRKKIDSVWSMRATLDVGNDNQNTVDKDDSRYAAYIKYAYLQAMTDLGFGVLTAQFGMIGTPVIDLIDTQSDYRWLNQNYIDASKVVLHKQGTADVGSIGQSIDNSADMGLSVSLNVAKMVTVTGAVANGEGYKKTNELGYHDDGKAMYAMITVNPLQGLYAAGYYRTESTHDEYETAEDNFRQYYGATLIYVYQGIRLGASYVLSSVSSAANVSGADPAVAKYTLLDVFVMVNLKSLTGVPVLLAGRYAMGTTKYDEGYGADDGAEATATLWAIGAGYQFNDSVRFMAYLEDQSSSSDDIAAADWEGSNRNFYVKAEVKF